MNSRMPGLDSAEKLSGFLYAGNEGMKHVLPNRAKVVGFNRTTPPISAGEVETGPHNSSLLAQPAADIVADRSRVPHVQAPSDPGVQSEAFGAQPHRDLDLPPGSLRSTQRVTFALTMPPQPRPQGFLPTGLAQSEDRFMGSIYGVIT